VARRIGVTVAMLVAAGVIGGTGGANAAQSPARHASSVECPELCPAVYDPVICLMSNGSRRKFGNACEAAVYACKHPGEIIGCAPALK
jgi:hypothetical protein